MKQGIPAIAAAILILLISACRQNPTSGAAKNPDSTTVFGDSVPISNGLTGKVFLLPDTTRSLPDFDTLTPLPNAIYAAEINVPWQKWSAGFPGLRGRFEWFGIEYTGRFQPHLAGNYHFKLISDDGSKLYIDDKLFLNNDGVHAEWAVKDSIYLSDSIHTIKIDYFQGPRYELELQLYWHLADSADRIFPGKDIVLYPPKPPSRWWVWLLIGLAIATVGFLIYRQRKNRSAIAVTFVLSFLIPGSVLHAQNTDSVAIRATALRDEFVTKIKGPGFTPALQAPKIVFDNPRSYGRYDPDSNVLHTSDWTTLDPESRVRFNAAGDANGMTGEKYFELSVHQWILIHELGHWWRACQHQTARPYENEMAANRIAIAFWRDKDPAFMTFKLTGYQRYLTMNQSPVPAGESKIEYLNNNYDKLPGGQAYTWYQATMIVDGCNETPTPTFRHAIERSGNATTVAGHPRSGLFSTSSSSRLSYLFI